MTPTHSSIRSVAALAAFLIAGALFAYGDSQTAEVHPLLPPKWAFGVLFGTYHNQAGVLNDMAQLRRDGYCGDLIWVDSSWLGHNYDGPASSYIDFLFDADQFRDAPAMIRALHENHFHFGVWEWPFIDKSNELYPYGVSHRLFVTDKDGKVVNAGGWHGVKFTGQFDFTKPEAVAWWNSLNAPLAALGVEFYKLDTGGGYKAGGVLSDGLNDQEHYRQLYHKVPYDLSAQAAGPSGRGFILTHQAPAHANVLTPGIWTGDTSSNWHGFKDEDMRIASTLDTPDTAAYWCGDTGGYNLVKEEHPYVVKAGDTLKSIAKAMGSTTRNIARRNNISEAGQLEPGQNLVVPVGKSSVDATDELYIRWLEYSAFTPIQEFFSSKPTKGRFPWVFGAEAQRIFRQYTELRYRLLPFRYSNAQIAYHESPVRYPVRFIGRSQIVVGNGDSELLVQPVTAPATASVSVALPPGSDWIDYWSGEKHAGGTSVTVATPLDREPIFIKAGSIIPSGPVMHYVDEVPADPLTVDIYPNGATAYSLYEDDGITTAYTHGAYRITALASDNTSGRERFTISAAHRGYTPLPIRTYLLAIHGQAAAPASVTRDGQTVPRLSPGADLTSAENGWTYDARTGTVWIKFRLPIDQETSISL